VLNVGSSIPRRRRQIVKKIVKGIPQFLEFLMLTIAVCRCTILLADFIYIFIRVKRQHGKKK